MFEDYLHQNSTYTSHRIWKGWLKAHPDEDVSEQLYDDLIHTEGSQFMAAVWMALGNIGTSAILQLHYLSFLMKFKGASRSALKICAQYGWISKLSSFDGWLEDQELKSERDVRYVSSVLLVILVMLSCLF